MADTPDSKGMHRRRFLRGGAIVLGAAAVGMPALKAAAECRLTEREILVSMCNY